MIYCVELSIPAEESLAWILHREEDIGEKIVRQLNHRLPYDPYPDMDDEQDLFHSEIVKSLEKEGYEVHRLKSREFAGYRVFYIVDDEEQLIYVLEVIEKSAETYDISTPHMQRIRDLYKWYYVNRLMKKER